MLRTSTRVSSGFILARHSSPSFGSQHVCSWYLPTARVLGHSGQSRIGRQNRAGRTRMRAETPTRSPPDARRANREPKQRRRGQQQICTTASNGKSRACAPLRTSASREGDGPPCAPSTREAGGKRRGKGTHPAHPPRPRFGMGNSAAAAGRGSAPEDADRGPKTPGRPPFTFITPLGLVRPMTRTHVRLLGPCFKTGRVGHRPFARRERVCPSATRPSQGSQDTRGFPLRPRKRRRRGTNPPGPSTSPATGRGDLHHEGKYARRRRLGRGHAQEIGRAHV